MGKNEKILIVDDDAFSALTVEAMCEEMHLPFSSFQVPSRAIEEFRKNKDSYSLIICDFLMPDLNGLQLIQEVFSIDSEVPIILITAHGSNEIAVEALKLGAFDYVSKPLNVKEMSIIVSRALKIRNILQEYKELQKTLQDNKVIPDSFIGKSKSIQDVFKIIKRVAPTNASILVNGETGTGKELVAQAIHKQSDRRNEKFVAVNCASIPEGLLESELFGHKKGAFTGADRDRAGLFYEADHGTLFLDEIGDMPMTLQSKLLRVIQEGKVRPIGSNQEITVDVRIITATHKNLIQLIGDEKFREDLFFRLNVVTIQLPTLRERSDDIPLLCDFFIKKYSKVYKSSVKRLTQEALAKLMNYDWPGNVRELENTIERAVIMCQHPALQESDLMLAHHSPNVDFKSNKFFRLPSLSLLEKDYLQFVLQQTGGKREKAADILGINRKTLYKKVKEYGLEI